MSSWKKRYLVRGQIDPLTRPSLPEIFKGNLVGGNAGNLMFFHSIVRTLLKDDTEIDYINTKLSIDDEEIERINSEYDVFIIPLANAFRVTFQKELRNITKLVRNLNIPAVVIGVGLKGSKINDNRLSFDFDETVKDFCDAVLEKSGIIGIRGEFTAQYLENLGYKEERDFTIIGCPSMYLFGEELPSPKEINLNEDIRMNFNCKASLGENIHNYLKDTCKLIPDHYYIAQNMYEFQTLLLGRNLLEITKRVTKTSDCYPVDYTHRLYRENRVRGFVSVRSWLDFIKKGDLNFGTRIHGNMTGVLSGVPTFVVAPDRRVLELARYHNIPHITINDLDTSKDIFHLLDGVDFSKVKYGHKQRFSHYLDFLHKNGLETIFDEGYEKSFNCKFDKKIQEKKDAPPLMPFMFSDYEKQLEAIEIWNWLMRTQIEKTELLREKNIEFREKNIELNNTVNYIKRRSLYYISGSVIRKGKKLIFRKK